MFVLQEGILQFAQIVRILMKEAVWHVANHQASDVPLVVRP